MIICPHCGAENPEDSGFCSLCLARFNTAQEAAMSMGQPPAAQPGMTAPPLPGQYEAAPSQPSPGYVSPSDYHALAQEMKQQNMGPGYRDSGYYQAAMQHPDAIRAMNVPGWAQKRSNTDIVLMVLGYSLLTYFVLFWSRFLVALILLGAAFGGSQSGFSIGLGIYFLADALVLALGGYMISAKAMHPGKGWLYGIACVAVVVFLWQPLVWMIFALLMTGEVYMPIFTIYGVLFTLFLELPMGALGGWYAEKRYMG